MPFDLIKTGGLASWLDSFPFIIRKQNKKIQIKINSSFKNCLGKFPIQFGDSEFRSMTNVLHCPAAFRSPGNLETNHQCQYFHVFSFFPCGVSLFPSLDKTSMAHLFYLHVVNSLCIDQAK